MSLAFRGRCRCRKDSLQRVFEIDTWNVFPRFACVCMEKILHYFAQSVRVNSTEMTG